jgi:hypothetical protein
MSIKRKSLEITSKMDQDKISNREAADRFREEQANASALTESTYMRSNPIGRMHLNPERFSEYKFEVNDVHTPSGCFERYIDLTRILNTLLSENTPQSKIEICRILTRCILARQRQQRGDPRDTEFKHHAELITLFSQLRDEVCNNNKLINAGEVFFSCNPDPERQNKKGAWKQIPTLNLFSNNAKLNEALESNCLTRQQISYIKSKNYGGILTKNKKSTRNKKKNSKKRQQTKRK